MANTLLTITQITREALRILHNNLVFVKGVNRQYSDQFARSGAKIGTTLNIRKPNRYYVRTGDQMQVQPTSETYVALVLTTKYGVDTEFSSNELTLSLDDFGKRILTPAMAKVASKIDYDGLSQFSNVYNCVGTPGTTPGSASGGSGLATYTAPDIFLNAGMVLDNNATPRDENRRVVMNPAAHAGSVAGLKSLLNDQNLIGENYRKGVLGSGLGFEFAMDQNVNNLTCGTRTGTTNTVNTTSTTGDTSILLNNQGSTGTVAAGDIFTIANVYGVNPENQQSTGQLQQFVVTSQVTQAAPYTVNVSPQIIVSGTKIPNATVNRLPTAADVVTFLGAASTVSPQSMAYHQDAFTFATADLEIPQGVHYAGRENYDGISMRIIGDYDITNDMFLWRIDVLGGWLTLRPEMACRIAG